MNSPIKVFSDRKSRQRSSERKSPRKSAGESDEKLHKATSLSTKKEEHHTAALPVEWTLEAFNDAQKEKIKAFREGAATFLKNNHSDLDLVRWLVARKWDVEAAAKMFVESMQWREKENVDNVMEWVTNLKAFKFLSDYWPISILPTKAAPKLRTFDGHLIIYERLTEMHPDILDIVSIDEMVKFHIYIQELSRIEQCKIIEQEKADTPSYAGIVFVYDIQSLTLSHLSRANYHMFSVFSTLDSNNYPETLRRVYIINSPTVFSVGWKVSKKFLDPVTISKIVILDNHYHEELKKVIPPESLPKAYGGQLDYLPSGGGPIKDIKKFF